MKGNVLPTAIVSKMKRLLTVYETYKYYLLWVQEKQCTGDSVTEYIISVKAKEIQNISI